MFIAAKWLNKKGSFKKTTKPCDKGYLFHSVIVPDVLCTMTVPYNMQNVVDTPKRLQLYMYSHTSKEEANATQEQQSQIIFSVFSSFFIASPHNFAVVLSCCLGRDV